MSKVKNHRLGPVGLALAAPLAVMAISASAAQAQLPAWMIGGTSIEGAATRTVTTRASFEKIKFEHSSGAKKEEIEAEVALLLSNTATGPIWIGCKRAEGVNNIIKGGGVGEKSVSFTECFTELLNSSKLMALTTECNPVEPIIASGKIEIILHGTPSVPYFKATGTGGVFTTIVLGDECALSETQFTIKGTAWLEDCEGAASFETEKEVHLIKEGMTAALALGGLKFGKSEFDATIDGSGLLKVLESGSAKIYRGLAA